MTFDDWKLFMIKKMYYGSITDLQAESGAEDPEHHLTIDAGDSPLQWWSK